MADVLQLPPLTAVEGQRSDFNWIFQSDYPAPKSPVDLSTWSGQFFLSTVLDGPAVVTKTLAMDASGNISVTLTADDLILLPTSPKIGGRVSAFYQLNLTAPDPVLNQVWQGGFSLARSI